MNNFKSLKNNIYRETYYETTRKGKMYLKDSPTLGVGLLDLLELLKGISVTTIQIRFFYTRFTTNHSQDLLVNHPEKFLTAIIIDTLVQNLPLTIRNIYSDHNTFIFDVCCIADDLTLRTILQEVLRHDAVSYVSRVEVRTTGEEEELFFLLQGRNNLAYPQTILPQNERMTLFPQYHASYP